MSSGVTFGKPVSAKQMTSTKGIGKRKLGNFKTERAARAKAAKLKKYSPHVVNIMGGWEVWVSDKYFRDHPKARGMW